MNLKKEIKEVVVNVKFKFYKYIIKNSILRAEKRRLGWLRRERDG